MKLSHLEQHSPDSVRPAQRIADEMEKYYKRRAIYINTMPSRISLNGNSVALLLDFRNM
jgi:hypothetical protein